MLATGMIVSLIAVSLTSNSLSLLFFERFLGNGIGFYFLGCLAWLVIQVVIPRTRGKQQAVQAAGLCVMISLIMIIVAVVWWREAADGRALPECPVASTAKEISELFQLSPDERRSGIFAVGVIGDPQLREASADETPRFLAYYTARGPGSGFKRDGDSHLPLILALRMADDAIVTLEGISSPRQAFQWPEGGPADQQRSLRHGDPVVVWADPGELVAANDGTRSPALTATRVIAFGGLDGFRREFLSDLVKTSRTFGWIAIVCMLLSAIPLSFGIRTLYRHRRAVTLNLKPISDQP